jgi:hypothetical protein
VTASSARTTSYARSAGAHKTSQRAALEHVGRRWFERADSDSDGRVTSTEAKRPLHRFELADTDGDGLLRKAPSHHPYALVGGQAPYR